MNAQVRTLADGQVGVVAIRGEKKQVHVINSEICTKCGSCRELCKFDAVQVI